MGSLQEAVLSWSVQWYFLPCLHAWISPSSLLIPVLSSLWHTACCLVSKQWQSLAQQAYLGSCDTVIMLSEKGCFWRLFGTVSRALGNFLQFLLPSLKFFRLFAFQLGPRIYQGSLGFASTSSKCCWAVHFRAVSRWKGWLLLQLSSPHACSWASSLWRLHSSLKDNNSLS